MLPNPIRIKGFTRGNRHEMIDHAVNTISRCTGWVTNPSMYANKVIVINFEIEARGVRELILSLNQNGVTSLSYTIFPKSERKTVSS